MTAAGKGEKMEDRKSSWSHIKPLIYCLITFAVTMFLTTEGPKWTSSGYAGRALTQLQFGGNDTREIVATWCDHGKILVINPFSGKWQFLSLEGQCAQSCDPHATHVRINRSVECEWLNAPKTPKPLIPERSRITPVVKP